MGSTRLPNLNSTVISSIYSHSIISNKNFWIFYFSIFYFKNIFQQLFKDFTANFKFKINFFFLSTFLLNKQLFFFFMGSLNIFKFQNWYFAKIFYFKKSLNLKYSLKIKLQYIKKKKSNLQNYKYKI